MSTTSRNWWPYLPVFILGATVLANIWLIRLALDTDDVLVMDEDPEIESPASPTPGSDAH